MNEENQPTDGWVDVLPAADLRPGGLREVVVGDQILVLINREGSLHALDGLCAHQGGPLSQGRLEGCTLTCPWHGWQYDVETGKQLLSETIAQRAFPIRVAGDRIEVRLHSDR